MLRLSLSSQHALRVLNNKYLKFPNTLLRDCWTDTERGVLLGLPKSAICVQRFDDSLNSAIRITYRISLRSSSLREPRYPLLRVVFFNVQVNKRVNCSSELKKVRKIEQHIKSQLAKRGGWWNRLICKCGLVTITSSPRSCSGIKAEGTDKTRHDFLPFIKQEDTVVCVKANSWQRSTPKRPKQHLYVNVKPTHSLLKGRGWKQVLD